MSPLAGGYGYEGGVFECACGKGVGLAVVDGNFGHADIGLGSQAGNGLHNPGFFGSVLLGADAAQAHAPFSNGFANEQRDDGATKAEDEGKDQQASQIEPLGGEVAVYPEQVGDYAQHHDDGQVGEDKEKDTLHGQPFACSVCGCDGVSCLWWWRQGFLQVPHVPQV